MLEKEFPILKRKVRGQRLIYLDNAATTQKPRAVIRAVSDFYAKHNANVHRAIHELSQEATALYEGARDKVQKFINARYREEIIFTSGCTEAINLVVWTWGHSNVKRGDEILLTEMEHHSNLVPWQELARKKGAKLRFIPLNLPPPHLPLITGEKQKKNFSSSARKGERKRGWQLDLSQLKRLLTRRTKIVALTHISNVLGTINPIKKIIKAAHKVGAKVLIDGAQAGAHVKIDVQKLDCDFYALSGHKMYGPTGVGVLYGKKELLEQMPPYQTGGSMISEVDWKSSRWNELPHKFEAGTPNIAQAVGLGAAIDFLNSSSPPPRLPRQPRRYVRGQGGGIKKKFPSLEGRGKGRVIDEVKKHMGELSKYALKKLNQIPGLTIYGSHTAGDRLGVFSFTVKGIPPHDLATLLDEKGVAVRTGHHCVMPLHRKLGLEGTTRASLAIYNTRQDVDKLIEGIKYAKEIFSA